MNDALPAHKPLESIEGAVDLGLGAAQKEGYIASRQFKPPFTSRITCKNPSWSMAKGPAGGIRRKDQNWPSRVATWMNGRTLPLIRDCSATTTTTTCRGVSTSPRRCMSGNTASSCSTPRS